jgi:cysteine synthase A
MESILEAIGNTPLVRVRRCAPPNGAELWLKLEYRNPTGSMKDRMGLALIVIADCFTEERFQLMRALGAELDVVPSVEGRPKVTPKDIENMVARAAELASAPDRYATDQFNNPYIIPDHRDRLGREIWKQSAGRVTAFCHAMGTASSVMGVSNALKPHGGFIQAHQPAGSAAISGGERGPFLIQGGLGSSCRTGTPNRSTSWSRSETTKRSR